MAPKSTLAALAALGPLAPLILSVLGLALLVCAAFAFCVIAGLAAAGIAFLIVAVQIEGKPTR